MSGEDTKTLRLNESYRYGEEETLSIPYTDLTDFGGAVLVECPDGTVRMFSKDEVDE